MTPSWWEYTQRITLCKPSACLFDKSQLSGTQSLSANMIYEADCISANKLCVLVKQRKPRGSSDVIRQLVWFKDVLHVLWTWLFAFSPGYGSLAGTGYAGARPGEWWIMSYLRNHYFPQSVMEDILLCPVSLAMNSPLRCQSWMNMRFITETLTIRLFMISFFDVTLFHWAGGLLLYQWQCLYPLLSGIGLGYPTGQRAEELKPGKTFTTAACVCVSVTSVTVTVRLHMLHVAWVLQLLLLWVQSESLSVLMCVEC